MGNGYFFKKHLKNNRFKINNKNHEWFKHSGGDGIDYNYLWSLVVADPYLTLEFWWRSGIRFDLKSNKKKYKRKAFRMPKINKFNYKKKKK